MLWMYTLMLSTNDEKLATLNYHKRPILSKVYQKLYMKGFYSTYTMEMLILHWLMHHTLPSNLSDLFGPNSQVFSIVH